MSERNVELVHAAAAAWNRRDFSALPELYHPAVELRESPEWPNAGVYRGLEAFERYFRQIHERFGPDVRNHVERCIPDGDRVFAFLHALGKDAEGGEYDLPFYAIYTFSEGRCVRMEGFLDRGRAQDAWGKPIPPAEESPEQPQR
jgi:ketosteroid isomerase-like protein